MACGQQNVFTVWTVLSAGPPDSLLVSRGVSFIPNVSTSDVRQAKA